MRARIAASLLVIFILALAGWGAHKLGGAATLEAKPDTPIPSAAVKRGDIEFTVSAKGELQGGNSEMLSASMAGGGSLALTFPSRLRRPREGRGCRRAVRSD
ncbi:MAG TPA: hypothetical protein VEX68_07370 [Bryobacteraceae bacterium]|nr:hypothetical protein [Bryobacteraceae bacterium]